MGISPEIERIYSQLLWVERRRQRIIESVSSHFGAPLVHRILGADSALSSPLNGSPALATLLDERPIEDFITALATEMDCVEARTVTCLRRRVSVYQEHVDEQILFGARTSGQEAGRALLSRTSGGRAGFDTPQAVEAVFELAYQGLPWDRNYFLCVRAQGASTVHFRRSPHLSGWHQGGADPRFLFAIKSEWIRGLLDILSPLTDFTTSQAIELGHPYGLAHFHSRVDHAAP